MQSLPGFRRSDFWEPSSVRETASATAVRLYGTMGRALGAVAGTVHLAGGSGSNKSLPESAGAGAVDICGVSVIPRSAGVDMAFSPARAGIGQYVPGTPPSVS